MLPYLLACVLALAITSPLTGWTQVCAFALVFGAMCAAVRRTTARG